MYNPMMQSTFKKSKEVYETEHASGSACNLLGKKALMLLLYNSLLFYSVPIFIAYALIFL
jgi:hypothetical protein